jgi:UDP-N-acetylenolpyruvoylglucosamine reductase
MKKLFLTILLLASVEARAGDQFEKTYKTNNLWFNYQYSVNAETAPPSVRFQIKVKKIRSGRYQAVDRISGLKWTLKQNRGDVSGSVFKNIPEITDDWCYLHYFLSLNPKRKLAFYSEAFVCPNSNTKAEATYAGRVSVK